jgi:hypothetical protein
MNLRKIVTLVALMLIGTSLTQAADIAGKWLAEFDSQIGMQKYSYEFKVEGDKISGKATYEHPMGNGTVVLVEFKLSGDDISFVEPQKIQDQEIRISYTGKITGNEIKLTRTVGDFATEEVIAKRAK